MNFACFGLTEREAGSDNSAIKTTAVKGNANSRIVAEDAVMFFNPCFSNDQDVG